jgi:hypothetical protein
MAGDCKMTVLELIKVSLRAIGAIASSQTPSSNASSDALEALNLLLGEWHNNGLIAFPDIQTFNAVAGTKVYTIGTSMTWNGRCPLRIISAYSTIDDIDSPIKVISESEYMEISEKDESGIPSMLFFSPSGSTGTVYLYGNPDQNCTITILSNKPFTAYTDMSTTILLPDGYLSALKYALAVEIAPEYEAIPSDWLLKRANETLSAIKKTNLKRPVPMKFNTPFSGSGTYNIETDTFS